MVRHGPLLTLRSTGRTRGRGAGHLGFDRQVYAQGTPTTCALLDAATPDALLDLLRVRCGGPFVVEGELRAVVPAVGYAPLADPLAGRAVLARVAHRLAAPIDVASGWRKCAHRLVSGVRLLCRRRSSASTEPCQHRQSAARGRRREDRVNWKLRPRWGRRMPCTSAGGGCFRRDGRALAPRSWATGCPRIWRARPCGRNWRRPAAGTGWQRPALAPRAGPERRTPGQTCSCARCRRSG
jgi:hypothetical protein